MECINKECNYNDKKGKCKEPHAFTCQTRIIPTHTPSYAEEQLLEHAKDTEKTCYNKECSGNKESQCIVKDRICISRQKEPINYEVEYHKLKQENENLNKTLEDALKEKNWHTSTFTQFNNLRYENIELNKIDEKWMKKCEGLKVETEKLKEINKRLEEENKNLNSIIDKKDDKIEELKRKLGIMEDTLDESQRLKEELELLKQRLEHKNNRINKLREIIKKLSELL